MKQLNPQSKRIQKEQPIRSKASAANQKQYRVKGSTANGNQTTQNMGNKLANKKNSLQ